MFFLMPRAALGRKARHRKLFFAAPNKLGAEKDRLALEHFDRDEECRGRIDAAREQNKQDVVPVKSAGDYFLADQAGAEDRNESKLRGKVEAGQEGGDRRDDYDKGHGSQVAGLLCSSWRTGRSSARPRQRA